jgi:neopullulanase
MMEAKHLKLAPLSLAFVAAALTAAAGCGADLLGPPDGGGGDAGVPVRACTTHFRYAGGAQSVALGGEWNKFDPAQTPMHGPDASGAFTADVALPPGAYGYKIVVDGNWILDPANPYSKYVDGVENSVVEVDDCDLPRLEFRALSKSAAGALHVEVQYVDGHAAAGVDPAALTVLLDGAPAATQVAPTGVITVDATGLATDKHRLTFGAADHAGRAAAPLDVPFWIEAEPFDFRDGLLYFAFTDRFQNGDPSNDAQAGGVDPRANYAGGDFAGIQQAIESGYFDSLGVRAIWISPPNANPDHSEIGTGGYLYTGYHGYWPTAGRDTQRRFGSLDALKSLVRAAHRRGIRVIVDSVLNHVHKEHPLYQAHASDGWFNGDGGCVCGGANCDWNTHALDCWFTNYLPDLDYRNFDAMKAMIDDALFWAREVDVDGFRVDAVKHFYHAATRRLRARLRDQFEHAGPLYYLVGETFDGDRGLINSFIGPNELLAQFDFPVYFNVRDALGSYSVSLRNLEGAANDSDAAFGSAPMSQFLGNHDVPRFVTIAAGMLASDPQAQAWQSPPGAPPDDSAYQKLQLAQTFTFTQPGVPLVYYGDEIGMPGAADPDNRRVMKWSGYTASEAATLDHARKLGAARAELRALRRGSRFTLWIDDDFYVYARVAGSEAAIVVINRAWTARSQSVPLPASVPLAAGTALRDRLGGAGVTVGSGALQVDIGPHTSAVLAP